MKKIELLSPAGDMEKLKCAVAYGADAVYLSGKSYGLRAYAGNFDREDLRAAIAFAHENGVKAYVTLNIFARASDYAGLEEYVDFLYKASADAVIVSDPGVFRLGKSVAPKLDIHISTQANVVSPAAADFWVSMGASRIVAARELNLTELKAVADILPDGVMLEAFVHGAMCVSYSGRCLLSDYFTGRNANRGECVQSCRWEYELYEKTRGESMRASEDERGTYILSSKDLCMIEHIDKLADAGITSFKIEGRVKTAYYNACVTGAYRRAIDLYEKKGAPFTPDEAMLAEVYKTSHRPFSTGFYFDGIFGGKDELKQSHFDSRPVRDYDFCAVVVEGGNESAVVIQRNRFKKGEVLEVLSPGKSHNKTIVIGDMYDEKGGKIDDALLVEQHVKIMTGGVELSPLDMLRRKRTAN